MRKILATNLDLSNKVAIVTGASKGIGESIARTLAAQGASVVVSSRKQDAVDQVAESIQKDGHDATGVACNVGNEDQVKQLFEATIAKYGGVDILVNNAATNPTFSPLVDNGSDVFNKIMNVNVLACHQLANLCHPVMKSRGGGSVINISSVEGMKPSKGLGLYGVSKAALIMLTQSQANEWGQDGIRSNVLCPGLVQTKFSQALWANEQILNQVTKHLPAGRMAKPDEMAGLVLFLASDASSYCTGSVFTADGGYMVAGA